MMGHDAEEAMFRRSCLETRLLALTVFLWGLQFTLPKKNLAITGQACPVGTFRDDCWLPMIADSSTTNLIRNNSVLQAVPVDTAFPSSWSTLEFEYLKIQFFCSNDGTSCVSGSAYVSLGAPGESTKCEYPARAVQACTTGARDVSGARTD